MLTNACSATAVPQHEMSTLRPAVVLLTTRRSGRWSFGSRRRARRCGSGCSSVRGIHKNDDARIGRHGLLLHRRLHRGRGRWWLFVERGVDAVKHAHETIESADHQVNRNRRQRENHDGAQWGDFSGCARAVPVEIKGFLRAQLDGSLQLRSRPFEGQYLCAFLCGRRRLIGEAILGRLGHLVARRGRGTQQECNPLAAHETKDRRCRGSVPRKPPFGAIAHLQGRVVEYPTVRSPGVSQGPLDFGAAPGPLGLRVLGSNGHLTECHSDQ